MSTDMNRDLGRLEGKIEGIVATLARVDERSAARDEVLEALRDGFAAMSRDMADFKKHQADMVIVTQQFNALQQAIRDGKNQVKGFGKGVTAGIWLAAASGGAATVAFGQKVFAWIFPS